MYIFVVQLFQGVRHIGPGLEITLGVFWIALSLPPEPVLHDEIQRYVPFAIFSGDIDQLPGGAVPILRLDEALRPAPEQWRVSGHFAMELYDGVDRRAVENIVVDGIRCFGG